MNKKIITFGQISVNFLMEAADTNGSAAMFEFSVPPESRVPMPHYHDYFDEMIYGLAGVITFTVEGKEVEIVPGQACFIPRGAVHSFNNLREVEAKALAVITPACLGPNYFKEISHILNAGEPLDAGKLKKVMAKHGLFPAIPKEQNME
jgi:quercetin dioxygenase-like cupin family protein